MHAAVTHALGPQQQQQQQQRGQSVDDEGESGEEEEEASSEQSSQETRGFAGCLHILDNLTGPKLSGGHGGGAASGGGMSRSNSVGADRHAKQDKPNAGFSLQVRAFKVVGRIQLVRGGAGYLSCHKTECTS